MHLKKIFRPKFLYFNPLNLDITKIEKHKVHDIVIENKNKFLKFYTCGQIKYSI